jgi:hypothetical protein
VGSNPLVLVDPWGFDGNDPDNPPPPDPNAPPVVVTAPFEIIPAILTFGPDPKEVAQFLASGMVGFVWGIMEDVSWGANRAPQGGGVGYNAGLMTGHTFTLVGSTIEFFGGAAIAAVGEPAVIAVSGGIVVSVYASQVAISAAKNMSEEMRYMHFSPDATESGGGSNDASEQREATFPDERELARRLEINKKDIHEVKKVIIKQHERLLKRANVRNPDIGFDRSGNIVFKDRISGRQIFTDTPLDSYKP